MIFPIPNSKFNILKEVYYNPGIRLTNLIKKVRVSSDTAQNTIKSLVNSDILGIKEMKGGKRVILKQLFPNLKTEEGKILFSLIELEKKRDFLLRNRLLLGPLRQITRNVGKDVKVILIFGSYANNSNTKESDLDLLFLVIKKINLSKIIQDSFSTSDVEVSPRIETISVFVKSKDAIHRSILNNHVVIHGASNFIDYISDLNHNT